MVTVQEGDLLFQPDEATKRHANLTHYMEWLSEKKGLTFQTYDQLWQWSVEDLCGFWESLWEYFAIAATPYHTVLSGNFMPNIKWFSGAQLNYSEHVFRNMNTSAPAIIAKSELRPIHEITWDELYEEVASFANVLRSLGVSRGDRVAAYVPNIYEAVVAFLASASIGAIWSSCSPDFGVMAVHDRFAQIKPKVLLCVDGYRYEGKDYVLYDKVSQLSAQISSIEHVIVIPYLTKRLTSKWAGAWNWQELIAKQRGNKLIYERVGFDHPLWILFSSGTTGLPKAIVHGHGGILLEHLKYFIFHADIKPGDRFFWYTTTGWMMWNMVVSALLTGTTALLYDGSPKYPDMNVLWQFAAETKMTTFGTSAGFLLRCMKEKYSPRKYYSFNNLRSIFTTASPLPPEGFKWVYDHVKQTVWLGSMSGGTDVCTAFVLHSPLHDVRAGFIQTRGLGAKVEAFNTNGEPVYEEVGELVLTKPLPSMPLYFWNDPDGTKYTESYFTMYPHVWRHGDWIKIMRDGSNQIYGRSDATINRGGIRIGTSEMYRAIETLPEIADSLIVDLSTPDGRNFLPLFVVLNKGYALEQIVKDKIKERLRNACSPRHVPDEIYEVPEVPYTLNDKKMEVPIKRILMGVPIEKAVNRGAMKNPDLLDYFLQFKDNYLP